MALLKKTTKKAVVKKVAKVKKDDASLKKNARASEIIVSPRITEKATMLAEQNAYTFIVSERATKPEIQKSIIMLYNVTPVKISVLPIPTRSVFRRGKLGSIPGGKKAVVYLKKGDKLELI
jgi:large subunit ribosomal protein L23